MNIINFFLITLKTENDLIYFKYEILIIKYLLINI